MMCLSPSDVITSPFPPTPAEIDGIVHGSDACAQSVVCSWDQPIVKIAARYARRSADREDLQQHGRLVLLRAVVQFDSKHGVPFSHYAKAAIRNEVSKVGSRLTRHIDKEQLNSKPFEHPLVKATAAPSTVLNDLIAREANDRVGKWLNSLPKQLQEIFTLIYQDSVSQRIAARLLGVSQPRVAQLHKQLLLRGRRDLSDLSDLRLN